MAHGSFHQDSILDASSLSCKLDGNLILNILLRLPVKSLIEYKRVCKNWYNVIENPTFIQMQSSRAEAHDLVAVRQDTDCVVGIFISKYNEWEKTGIWIPGTLAPVGTSYGLICFAVSNNFSDMGQQFLVMNPAINTEFKNEPQETNKLNLFGFGYCRRDDDFKIVWIQNIDYAGRLTEVSMYSLYTDSWKSFICWVDIRRCKLDAVHSGDFLYWLCTARHEILAFSLRTEKLFTMPLPGCVESVCEIISCGNNDSLMVTMYDPMNATMCVWEISPIENLGSSVLENTFWRRLDCISSKKSRYNRESPNNNEYGNGLYGYSNVTKISNYAESLVPVNQGINFFKGKLVCGIHMGAVKRNWYRLGAVEWYDALKHYIMRYHGIMVL